MTTPGSGRPPASREAQLRARAAARRAAARRAAARRAGRIRLAIMLVLLGSTIGLVVSLTGGGTHPGDPARPQSPAGHTGLARATRATPPAVEAGLLPWRLNVPLSRPVVLPAANRRSLVVAGGLESSGTSAEGVFAVSTASGAATQIGRLTTPLHDAAGAVIGGAGYVFGGGATVPVETAQGLATLGTTKGVEVTSQAAATTVSPLPQPRADAVAVTIGTTAYVIGGYDGAVGDAAVLSTTDGRRYSPVADLPVPVRYPAAAAWHGRIYVFGGDATSGAHRGQPVTTVQMIDPATHTARIVGALPEPIAGSAAATLGGVIYLAGGETVSPSHPGASPAPVGTVWAWLPAQRRAAVAGRLLVPVSHAGVAVLGSRAFVVGGETTANLPTSDVQMFEPNKAFGSAGSPGAGSPYFGDKLLIADRGNNRLLVLDDTGKIIWTYPSRTAAAPKGGFYFPDDAFFTHHGTQIISNQEENQTIVQIAYPSGKVLWSYGHPRQPGSAPGYLNSPDDAYLLPNGNVAVADPVNCRVLVLSPSHKIVTQIGTIGSCLHSPPTDLGSPNGDTPLSNGDLLVSEINGSWVDEFTITGRLVWAAHLPIGYPSDPQSLGAGRYLVANYETPGGIVEFTRRGRILQKYAPSSGSGELNRPSLVELLPSGVFMANDDYNDRMVAIDPATGALVWQYGRTGIKGTAPGLLNTPDGFDLLGPHGTFPTHPSTG